MVGRLRVGDTRVRTGSEESADIPVCMRTCVRRLKSSENRFPHPSNVHWNGFSPVCTSWCRFNLLDSTNAFPHSAHTWTRGPCVCRCFLMALLSRNILEQPVTGRGSGTSVDRDRDVYLCVGRRWCACRRPVRLCAASSYSRAGKWSGSGSRSEGTEKERLTSRTRPAASGRRGRRRGSPLSGSFSPPSCSR